MRRAALIAFAFLGPAVAAPAGLAAMIKPDHSCYLAQQKGVLPNGQNIAITGTGFTPNAPVALTFNGQGLDPVTAGPTGAFVANRSSPAIASGFKAHLTIAASDGLHHGNWVVPLRNYAADFLPATTQNAEKQKVRFYVYGFGPLLTALKRSTTQPVYMHVFQPGGKLRATFKVGHTGGPCGDMRTARRRILPFGLKNGTWTYRFTTAKRYSAKSLPQAEVGFKVKTVFRPA
jgi:hypothetical protein